MQPQISIGVANQVIWPKAGDVDDCACVAMMQAVLAAAPWERMVSITRFREAAGNPDNVGVPDGHSISECATAARVLWPKLASLMDVSTGGLGKEKVLDLVRDEGRPAMIFVRASALPSDQQYGFGGLHACAIAFDDQYKIANPLAPAHSRWREIGRDRLGEALRQMPGTGAKAIVMPTLAQAFRTHPLYEAPTTPGELDARLAAKDRALDEILASATKGRAV